MRLCPRFVIPLGLFAACAAACGASSNGVHGPTVDFDAGAGAGDGGSGDAGVGSGDGGASSDADAGSLDGGATGAADPAVWQPQVVYLVMPDRFFNGDPTNDDAGSPGCFDPTSANLFHGGDIAGLRQKLGYMKELGVTAVWATPFYKQTPLRNGACGYHGYV